MGVSFFYCFISAEEAYETYLYFFFLDAMGYLQPSVKFRPEMAMFNQLYEGNANTIAKEVY